MSVAGAMLKSKGVLLMSAYIGGDITAPDHLLTAGWRHGSFFRPRAKCVLSSQRLKKLGLGFRLGGLARSAMTVSYSLMVSVLFFILILLADGFVVGFTTIIIICWETNTCQMLDLITS